MILIKFTGAMYRRAPGYTRAVFAMVGIKVNNEAEIREVGEKLLLLAVKSEANIE